MLKQQNLPGRPFRTVMKEAVTSTDCKFCLSNHDRTHRSPWGCTFEQLRCTPPSGRCCLPSHSFYCEARMRNVPQCLPKVTHSSAIMRYTQHREASVSFSPSHGESLLSPFLHASYTRLKLLNPRNTVLWDSAGAILQGQWGWIWHISLFGTRLPSAWIGRARPRREIQYESLLIFWPCHFSMRNREKGT